MEKRRITEEGKNQLLDRLESLRIERLEVVNRLEIARSFGDLKENAEYNESKTSLKKIDQETSEIKSILGNCVIISSSNSDFVSFGSVVTIENKETKEESVYKIVGDTESDISEGLLSENSLIAKNMINHKIGFEFSITSQRGTKYFIIKKIS